MRHSLTEYGCFFGNTIYFMLILRHNGLAVEGADHPKRAITLLPASYLSRVPFVPCAKLDPKLDTSAFS